MIFRRQELLDTCRLDGVLTVVDCINAEMHLDEKRPDGGVNEALGQASRAPRLRPALISS